MKKTLLKLVVLSTILITISIFFIYQNKETVLIENVQNDIENKETPSELVKDAKSLDADQTTISSNYKKEKLIKVSDLNLPTEVGSSNAIDTRNSISDSIKDLQDKYTTLLNNNPFTKTKNIQKKERKAMGLPPNAYFEQEWVYSANPALGRPEPEVAFQLQKELDDLEKLNRVPGDGIDNQWVNRGPNNVGGRTRVLVFAPGSTTKVFAGSVSGGLWVNNDITSSTSSWTLVNGIPGNLAVTCMTVDPNNSSIMYIGTGEIYTGGDVNGNGVYKSTDGGINWKHLYGAATSTNVRDNITYIQDIIAWNNPTTNLTEVYFGVDAYIYGQEVIAATGTGWSWLGLNRIGLYKSTDGLNFNRLEDAVLKNASNRHYAPNTFDIGADGKLWMGTKDCKPYTVAGGMIFSTTNGTTWNNIRDFGTNGRVEVVASKQNPGRLYVLLENRTGGGLPAIRRTTDGFATINTTVPIPTSSGNQPPAANDFCRGQAFYDLMIGMNPANDSEVFVGGIEIFRNINAFKASPVTGDWTQYTDWTVAPTNNGSTATQRDGVHSDHHCMAFAPGLSNRVVFGCDGGVYYSNDSGNSIGIRNKDYITTQFVKAGINQTGGTQKLIAGAQDNGTQFINNAPAGAGASSEIAGGDGFYCFVDEQDEYMISSYVYNVYKMHNMNGGQIGSGIINDQASGDFVNQCGLDSSNNILYTNASNTASGFRLLRLILNPATGAYITGSAYMADALLNNTPTAFVSSPYTNNRLLVGVANGKLLQVNGANATGSTWSSIGDPSWIGAISSVRYGANANEIFVTFHNYGVVNVWYTSNGGTSWQNKEGDLPNIPVKCILRNPFASNEVIIGTELGAWYTNNFTNASPNWYRANNGMKDTKVTAFDYRVSDNTILASTYGRGVFTGEFWQCGSTTTTWNGTTWSNGVPNKRVAAVINGNLSSTGTIEACSFTVNGTAQVTINSGHSLKVGEGVTVASGAKLTIEINAALVQFTNTAVNTGNIVVKRASTAMIRQNYTAWSSPVVGQQLQAFSPNTLSNRFYEYLFTGTTTPTAYQSVTATTNFLKGKGYMIRVANDWSSSSPAVYNGEFTGVPTNGFVNVSVGLGYNLIGNPYASPIDADRIIIEHPDVNTLYFWTNTTAPSGGVYPQNNFAAYTLMGGTSAFASSKAPNGIIQTGQGFYLYSDKAGTVAFENNIRRDAAVSSQFYKTSDFKEDVAKNRMWLNLNDSNTEYNQILIGYTAGATKGFDAKIDGLALETNSNTLYSLVDEKQLVIQGLGLPFSKEDVIPLGAKFSVEGAFTIGLDHLEGLFDSQEVYLKDNFTGTYHEIKKTPYYFLTEKGVFNNRFEIVFQKASKNTVVSSNELTVYASNGEINIISSKEAISSIEVYDVLGKQIIIKNNIKTKSVKINDLPVSNQALLVKVTLENGTVTTKKIMY